VPVDMSSKEGKDYMESRQRQQLMNLLYEDLKSKGGTPGSPEYEKQEKRLQKIESFKLNRTPTFYYLAYKYGRLH